MKSLDTYELRIGTSPYAEARHLENVEAADDEALKRYAVTRNIRNQSGRLTRQKAKVRLRSPHRRKKQNVPENVAVQNLSSVVTGAFIDPEQTQAVLNLDF